MGTNCHSGRMKTPQTHIDAVRVFGDEATAHSFFVGMRWPNGVTCPHCQSARVGDLSVSHATTRKGTVTTRRIWNCKDCKKQFTVKVGTLFEDSALPLSKWLPAVWMIVNAKNGISSCEMARGLGVTQKTAWFMLHRIRGAMHDGKFTMSGVVEADETLIGGRARNMHKSKRVEVMEGTRNLSHVPVAGLLQRTEGDSASRVNLKIVRRGSREILQKNVRENVTPGSSIFTDALASYRGLNSDFIHEVVDHAVAYVRGNVHTNGLENFWSLLKRTLKGTYVCPAPFHLFRYLDEQAMRFNERKDNDAGRFMSTLSRLAGRRLTWDKLTGKEDVAQSLA